ncbi:MAG TPA: hypothetical protein VF152_01125 [Acidimicrobiia bacterium]
MREQTTRRASVARTAAWVAVAAYALVLGTTESFTWPAALLTAGSAVLVVLLAARTGLRRPPSRAAVPPSGILAWLGLGVAVGVWWLSAYLQSPRSDHPTVSSLLDAADAHVPLRAAVFLGWLLLGVTLARR